ncbi:hypothetical protein HanIR_Chr06g0265581 [Helianthus annuus]|nr:hypothetical protein HanIR_Chr06g0265581 [Helianthus annuus]
MSISEIFLFFIKPKVKYEHTHLNILQTRTCKQKVKHERGNQISKFKWISNTRL